MNSRPFTFSYAYLLTMSFVEGSAVMGVELASAKMIAPFYGNTLYVWAAILGITLLGLLCGYLLGGAISKSYQTLPNLFIVLLIGGLLVLAMPYTSNFILETSLNWEVRSAITISALTYLFPPLVCFGMVTPMIIQLLGITSSKYGRIAGTVYAISTSGGILITFLYGFYMLPFIGLKISVILIALFLLIFPAHYAIKIMIAK